MKILLVSPYDVAVPGGVTSHLFNLEKQFCHLGHEVKILAPCSNLDGQFSAQVIPLGRPIPVPSGGSFARITLSFRLDDPVKAILERERFDIVHAHEPLTPMLPKVVLRWASCPKVGTFHAYHEEPLGYGLTKFFLKRWFRHLDGLIAVSQPAKEFVSKHFPGEYEIIPNGVNLEHFCPSTLPLPQFWDEKKNILFIGRLEKRKGAGFLIRAFRRVKQEYGACRLIIAGPGVRLRQQYEELARDIPDVVFAGPIDYDELPRYYASAHIFCAPAIGGESFGMVLLEAMAAGKPVVATDIPGYLQVLTQGEQGLVVPPRDEKALAQALLKLLENPALCEEMGRRGRLRAQEYGWEKIATRVLSCYQRFL